MVRGDTYRSFAALIHSRFLPLQPLFLRFARPRAADAAPDSTYTLLSRGSKRVVFCEMIACYDSTAAHLFFGVSVCEGVSDILRYCLQTLYIGMYLRKRSGCKRKLIL